MRMLISLGLFDTDPIVTGGTGGGTMTPKTPSPDPCVKPSQGLPAYDAVVLDTLHGEGVINRADYQAVRAGTRSIEDLNLTPEQLQRLRCGESPKSTGYNIHFDPNFPPEISSVTAGLGVAFSSQHKPTDKTHRITVTMDGAASLSAGARVCRVTFGTEYVQEPRVPVVPVVIVSGVGGAQFWRAGNITASGYDLFTDSGVPAGATVSLQVLVEPTRR